MAASFKSMVTVSMLLVLAVLLGMQAQAQAQPLMGMTKTRQRQSRPECGTVGPNLSDVCKDFLEGKYPPTPFPTSPCCKAARQAKSSLSCLCGSIDLSKVTKASLIRFNTFCLVELNCLRL